MHQATKAANDAGEVDLLVNNAGISVLESFLDTNIANFDNIMNVNGMSSSSSHPHLFLPFSLLSFRFSNILGSSISLSGITNNCKEDDCKGKGWRYCQHV